MKRHSLLIPLSQDHHHSLAMCARILRDPAADHRADFAKQKDDLLAHFAEEEALFAPWHSRPCNGVLRKNMRCCAKCWLRRSSIIQIG